LAVEVNATNNNFYDVGWSDGTGILTDITDNITRGELGGLLEIRDRIVPSYIGKVDKLAAGQLFNHCLFIKKTSRGILSVYTNFTYQTTIIAIKTGGIITHIVSIPQSCYG